MAPESRSRSKAHIRRAPGWLPALGLILALGACQLFAQNPGAEAPGPSQTRIAASVQATGTALAQIPPTRPPPTDTPSTRKPLRESILTGSDLNLVLGIWPLTPEQFSFPNTRDLCIVSCYEELWFSSDGRSTLQISLYELASRDQAVTELRDIHASQQIIGVLEIDLPESVALPDESWMQDNQSSGSRYTLHTRQGKVLAILTLYLPDFDEGENALFLSLYAARQVEMLKNSGW